MQTAQSLSGPVDGVTVFWGITYLVLEANREKASFTAKLQTPLKVEQEESGLK